jgi:hypothetical protein
LTRSGRMNPRRSVRQQCPLYDRQRLLVLARFTHANDCNVSETVRSRSGGRRQQPLQSSRSIDQRRLQTNCCRSAFIVERQLPLKAVVHRLAMRETGPPRKPTSGAVHPLDARFLTRRTGATDPLQSFKQRVQVTAMQR